MKQETKFPPCLLFYICYLKFIVAYIINCKHTYSTYKHFKWFYRLAVPPDISDEESSSDLTIKEGEKASLYCHAHGHPTPRITWRRNDGTPIWLSSSGSSSSANNKNASTSATPTSSQTKTINTKISTTIKGMQMFLSHLFEFPSMHCYLQ